MMLLNRLATQHFADIKTIHQRTAIYTAPTEIEVLLDCLGWPQRFETLLDPGAGNGGFVVAALNRLVLPIDDISYATSRIKGYEFYPEAVKEARQAVFTHLLNRGWSGGAARSVAESVIEERDFLLDPIPTGWAKGISANPPYLRSSHLPPSYRRQYTCTVPAYAYADLLYAYLEKSAEVIAPDGEIGLITADRWLFNVGSSTLRERLGKRFTIVNIERLDATSAFYRPKNRQKGTPPRVHPVRFVLSPERRGRHLGREPFRIESLPDIQGVPLASLAHVQLAPWIGPQGIFIVQSTEGLPEESLIPLADFEESEGGETVRSSRRWAIATDTREPDARILAHLANTFARMPQRGKGKTPWWLPPETFLDRLPLAHDAVLVPRIAKKLRPRRLPAGQLPINHDLVIDSDLAPEQLIEILNDKAVQAQATVLAHQIDGGYRSYSTSLLRQLVIPHSLIPTESGL